MEPLSHLDSVKVLGLVWYKTIWSDKAYEWHYICTDLWSYHLFFRWCNL